MRESPLEGYVREARTAKTRKLIGSFIQMERRGNVPSHERVRGKAPVYMSLSKKKGRKKRGEKARISPLSQGGKRQDGYQGKSLLGKRGGKHL